MQTFVGHTGVVLALTFNPDGEWLASGSGDRAMRLWRTGADSRDESHIVLHNVTNWM